MELVDHFHPAIKNGLLPRNEIDPLVNDARIKGVIGPAFDHLWGALCQHTESLKGCLSLGLGAAELKHLPQLDHFAGIRLDWQTSRDIPGDAAFFPKESLACFSAKAPTIDEILGHLSTEGTFHPTVQMLWHELSHQFHDRLDHKISLPTELAEAHAYRMGGQIVADREEVVDHVLYTKDKNNDYLYKHIYRPNMVAAVELVDRLMYLEWNPGTVGSYLLDRSRWDPVAKDYSDLRRLVSELATEQGKMVREIDQQAQQRLTVRREYEDQRVMVATQNALLYAVD